ncbi:hypothetical protein [Vulgatibacter sp.]|uniref:hypothetical protein n=1 Tax=Vulgatibacter sp. TaxID=1971226 RepID=UPI0035650B29
MTARKLLVAASILAFALPAYAEEEAKEGEAATKLAADGSVIRGNANSPWRGSSLTYEHVTSTISFDKGAELTYNPYYAHTLGVAPRYYLRDDLYVGAALSLQQELTNSDWTTDYRQWMFSDLNLSAGWSGWQEPVSQIRVTGSLAVALPLSLVSQASTQILSVAPAIRIARNFDVGGNLNVSWNGRWTQRFHSETSPVRDDCGDCSNPKSLGYLNAWGDFSTGPSVVYTVMPQLNLFADMRWSESFLYDNTTGTEQVMDVERSYGASDFAAGFDGRYGSYFGLGASYDIVDEATVSATVATPSPQLAPDGTRRSPFFNRFTQVGVGLTLNLDPLAARVLQRN